MGTACTTNKATCDINLGRDTRVLTLATSTRIAGALETSLYFTSAGGFVIKVMDYRSIEVQCIPTHY